MKENLNGAIFAVNERENNAAWIASKISNEDGFCNTPEVLERPTNVKDSINTIENKIRAPVAPCTISSREMEFFDGDQDLSDDNSSNGSESRDSIASCTIPSTNMGLFEESYFYSDKNVLECELPELVVCYKENTDHVVKDICIDEGVPSTNKILVEDSDSTPLGTVLLSDGKRKGGVTEGEEMEILSPNVSKSSAENKYPDVDANECGTKLGIELLITDAKKLSSESEVNGDTDGDGDGDGGSLDPVQTGKEYNSATEKIVDDVSKEKFVANSRPSSQKLGKHRSFKSLLNIPDFHSNEVEEQSADSAQIPGCEAICETLATEESNKSNPVNNLLYNSKMEAATISYSPKLAASGRDESPGNVDHEQPLETDTEAKREEGTSNSLTAASQVQKHDHGESSFSMAGPASGLITYSGPIAYSGSVSLRSESSATSTRSFAFPVLQSEWNFSPARMAKADRSRLRRSRCWRQGLLCCRF